MANQLLERPHQQTVEAPVRHGGDWGLGLKAGLLGTLIMSLVMLVGMTTGMTTGIAPMPRPIPAAIMGRILGPETPMLLIMGSAIAAHFAYGGFWGAVFARMTRRPSLSTGVGLGVVLWALMQIVVLPFIGWGAFGLGVDPKIAVATLVLHLIYGATVGAVVRRSSRV